MDQQFKKGDHVRLVVDAVVEISEPLGFTYLANESGIYLGGLYTQRGGVMVEKVVPPLPTTPGSTIQYKSTFQRKSTNRRTLMRLDDGGWVDSYGGRYSNTLAPENFIVLHDAGKAL